MRKLSLLLLLAVTGGVWAAEPASGTITPDNTLLEFTGGPFVAANVFGNAGDPECIEPVFPCDHFLVTIDLPDGFVEMFPSAIIRMVVMVDSPGANVREDYDIYLYDTAGNLVAESASEGGTESIGFLAENGESTFELTIVPFTATGSTIAGRIELVPGEPANPVPGRSLDGAGPRGGQGSLGGFALLMLVAGWRHRSRRR